MDKVFGPGPAQVRLVDQTGPDEAEDAIIRKGSKEQQETNLAKIRRRICTIEKIKLEGVIREIASLCVYNADGIPRDAVMLFEKFYAYSSAEEVSKELKNVEEHISEEIWDMVNAIDKDKFDEFLDQFSKMKRGNFESFRITFGNIFKKKLLTNIKTGNKENAKKYYCILQMFRTPVDNQLGDIELIARFHEYMEFK